MTKGKINVVFIVMFVIMISLPFIFARRNGIGISREENRTLSVKPTIIEAGKLNLGFTYEYEDWFVDNLGFRNELTNLYARMQYYVFDNVFDTNKYVGRTGDLIYATPEILLDYQHLNLYSEEEEKEIIDSYQMVNDWLEEQEIQFYYVQCYDKQTIYPERFMDYVNQNGDMSRTDQIVQKLESETDINVVSLKQVMLDNRDEYDVFYHYGDPTHWSKRGAFICYQEIMQAINVKNGNCYRILQEEDYKIDLYNVGSTIKGNIRFEEEQEAFTLINPNGYPNSKSLLQQYGDDERNSVWTNPKAGNDTKVLIIGDSYIYGYLLDSFAESFSEMYMVHGDYTTEMQEVVELCQPDIVIYECAERVNRNSKIRELAKLLHE